jgi:hypothetical protein
MSTYNSKEAVRTARLRRWAARLGLRMTKSRGRRFHANDYGEFMLADTDANTVVAGARYDMSLDDIEAHLGAHEATLKRRAVA